MRDTIHIDLHMHTTVSDGNDTPEMLLQHVKEKGIEIFAVTDHDAVKGYGMLKKIMRDTDPVLLSGAEFSCRDEEGKYHILGYGFDPDSKPVRDVVDMGHAYRMDKIRGRLEGLKNQFDITFPEEEVETLLSMDNPGKPHIGNLMVKYGYAASKDEAITDIINQVRYPAKYVRPEEAIEGILRGGGIPVLAHGPFGSGDELIIGMELDHRIRRLMKFGLLGVEGFYSGYTRRLRREVLLLAKRYDLFVTAGSDYHGSNKLVVLGDTGLTDEGDIPEGMRRFFRNVRW